MTNDDNIGAMYIEELRFLKFVASIENSLGGREESKMPVPEMSQDSKRLSHGFILKRYLGIVEASPQTPAPAGA